MLMDVSKKMSGCFGGPPNLRRPPSLAHSGAASGLDGHGAALEVWALVPGSDLQTYPSRRLQ